MTATPPIARSLVLTDDGAMPYATPLAAFDGTVAGFTLATAPITAHVLVGSIPGAADAFAAIDAAIVGFGQRLTAYDAFAVIDTAIAGFGRRLTAYGV